MPDVNILVIAVDGLRAAALGAYGNTAFPTPALDQFAAESLLLDECFADATELPAIYRALWESRHPLRDKSATATPLPRLLADRGYATTLVTDDPAIAALSAAAGFADCAAVADAAAGRATDIAETHMARLCETACEHLGANADSNNSASETARRLVWVHARGLYGPWDAPLELQESLLEGEEGDPSPCEALEPPDLLLGDRDDPDAAFRWSCGYAAQVIALDACVAGLREFLQDAAPQEDWLMVLLGVRGFPLGEHGRIGGVDGRLTAEQLHVPMLWRFPDGTARLARSGRLVSHLDFTPTVLDWIGRDEQRSQKTHDGSSLLQRGGPTSTMLRDALVAASAAGGRSIRTAGWCLRCEPVDHRDAAAAAAAESTAGRDQWHRELFVRPDDRWEANDIADRCPEVVDTLSEVLGDASRRLSHGEPLPANIVPDSVPASAD